VVFVYVSGHQDDWLLFLVLTCLEQLNVEMDAKAKTFLCAVLVDDQIPWCSSTIAHEGWQCYIMGHKITSDPGPLTRFNVFGSKLLSKLVDEGQITPAAFQNTPTGPPSTGLQLTSPLHRLCVAKHVSGFFGIGHVLKQREFWGHSRCPCCDNEDETKEQLSTCPHPDCASTWTNSLADFFHNS
jgi:hypothetical protein